MTQSLTIAKRPPDRQSMNYAALRNIGIERIQELAGLLWTDYNTHDPGVTIMEVLSYVLTDIGYRSNYDIQDILAQAPGDITDIKNFYTASQILPNSAVTFNDYRKLLIDVDVHDESDEACDHVGVKNAWIHKSTAAPAEQKIYVDRKRSQLSLNPIENIAEEKQEYYYVKVLYDVLLELGKCDRFGDLNSNIEEITFALSVPEDPFEVEMRIDFRRWDEEDIDWGVPIDVSQHIEKIRLTFPGLASDSILVLEGGLSLSNIIIKQGGLDFVNQAWVDSLLPFVEQLFNAYAEKINKILEIIDEVRSRLNANRNLCDDFYKINALKVEEILLCADIELSALADVEQVEAEMMYHISRFLSPTVYFYTLDEMLNRCRRAPQYKIEKITKSRKTITISTPLQQDLNNEDQITVVASDTNVSEYSVKCIKANRENPNHTDIEVKEEITNDKLDVDIAHLIKGTIDEDRCLTVDKIFEGPKLQHGFIDDEELEKSERMKFIHVSDLIRIIMDVTGVIAVRNIQIANRPQDNDANIESKSVKWCLELAVEHNYVPRLSISDSSLTYYKDQIPFIAKSSEVQKIFSELESNDRPQKIYYPIMDITIPKGSYMELENYTSLQEEFPVSYGIGSRGIPGLARLDAKARSSRVAKAKQLKGFLLFFDQFAANYLSQLEHVKDLFSMNGDKNIFGEYKINQTYFTQPLYDIVPNADPLYVNKAGHLVALQNIIEDKDLYEKRRNKFLDHLLGRFAETFTDYALLIYRASGVKATSELIEDKLNFLHAYPALQSARGKGSNYLSPCMPWHIDNPSGLEQRGSLLLGMPQRTAADLAFSPDFIIIENAGSYTFEIVKAPAVSARLRSPEGITYDSEDAVKIAIESVVANGSCKENYVILPSDDTGTVFMVHLQCEDQVLAVSRRKNFNSNLAGGDADTFIDNLINDIILEEYCHNAEANRKNLSLPILNYVTYEIVAIVAPPEDQPPQYNINYSLFSKPFDFVPENLLMTGTLTGAGSEDDTEEELIAKGEEAVLGLLCQLVHFGTSRANYAYDFDEAPVSNYTFIIEERNGVEIGRSNTQDYNDAITNEINNLNPKEVSIGPDDTFIVNSVITQGAEIEIDLTEAPPESSEDLDLSYTQSFSILSIDVTSRLIEISTGVDLRLFPNDQISIIGPDEVSNLGIYTIRSIDTSGPNTVISTYEAISTNDTSGMLSVSRSYEISNIHGTKVRIIGLDDERAINNMIQSFLNKFASNEGLHIIEHTLLRPKINESHFLPAGDKTLDDSILNLGDLHYQKEVPILSTNTTYNLIFVTGDITEEVSSSILSITGNSPNDGTYNIQWKFFHLASNRTIIRIKENLLFEIPDADHESGNIVYTRTSPINAIISAERKITISNSDAINLLADDIIEIKDSGGILQSNDGRYKVESTSNEGGGDVGIVISAFEHFLQDALLPIHLDEEECSTCQQVDPYSCIISVVLPYWAGKFTNLDIRKFIEKTIRLEAPAHLLLNICWIDCEQMAELECKYKKWLIEIGKSEKNSEALVMALAELIDILSRLRNVYPGGTLHSCDDDDTFEGSIILNNSVLGSF